MQHMYLRFSSQEAAETALRSALLLPDDGLQRYAGGMRDGVRYDLEVVGGDGIIARPTGVTIETADGSIPEVAPIDGYHVNLLWWGEIPPMELSSYQVAPTAPAVMYSGVMPAPEFVENRPEDPSDV